MSQAEEIAQILATCGDYEDFQDVSQQVSQMLEDLRYMFLLRKLFTYAVEERQFMNKKQLPKLAKLFQSLEIRSHSHMEDNLGGVEQIGGTSTLAAFPVMNSPPKGLSKVTNRRRKVVESHQQIVFEFNAYYEYPSGVDADASQAGRAKTRPSHFHEIMEISYFIYDDSPAPKQQDRPKKKQSRHSQEHQSSSNSEDEHQQDQQRQDDENDDDDDEEPERIILVTGERTMGKDLKLASEFLIDAESMDVVKRKLACADLSPHEFTAFLFFIFYGSACEKCMNCAFALVDGDSTDEELALWDSLPLMVSKAKLSSSSLNA
eukprot:TRINITY_DN4347_c0_g1_i1.p1 TRINITY_DN4347_c0_g1~~TRINITY_DN4347_c0_g1_i1.p1  ORF type:complete len:319 (+),score=89.07 TRINITY_DN4347_c0_g1_i1:40-996(+)